MTDSEKIHKLAVAMYNMPNSVSCKYCTKDKCRHNGTDKSCIDCISDYWKRECMKND